MEKLPSLHDWLPFGLTEFHLLAFIIGVVAVLLPRIFRQKPLKRRERSDLAWAHEAMQQAEWYRSAWHPGSQRLSHSNPSPQPITIHPTSRRVRIFIDYPNFLRSWRSNLGEDARVDWANIPSRLLEAAANRFGWKPEHTVFLETSVYNSFVPYDTLARYGITPREAFSSYGYRSRKFLLNDLSVMPGYAIYISDRKPEWDDDESEQSPTPAKRESKEEGVDTALMTDLLIGAADNSYDVALLLTDDADYISAVRGVQSRYHKQVIQIGFVRRNSGLKTVCWGHIPLDEPLTRQLRQATGWITRNPVGIAEEKATPPPPSSDNALTLEKMVKQIVKAKVTRVVSDGAECEFNVGTQPTKGFLHKHQIADNLEDATTALTVGKEIYVRISFVNDEGEPRLTMKFVNQNPTQP